MMAVGYTCLVAIIVPFFGTAQRGHAKKNKNPTRCYKKNKKYTRTAGRLRVSSQLVSWQAVFDTPIACVMYNPFSTALPKWGQTLGIRTGIVLGVGQEVKGCVYVGARCGRGEPFFFLKRPHLKGSSCFFSHTSTFQLLDKPWSQVSSLLPLSSCLHFLSRIGFSNPTARQFSSNVANSRSRVFRKSICAQQKIPTN